MTLDKLRDLATHAKPEATFSPSTVLALLDRQQKAIEALEIVSYGECECVLQDNLCAVCIAEEALTAIREPLP